MTNLIKSSEASFLDYKIQNNNKDSKKLEIKNELSEKKVPEKYVLNTENKNETNVYKDYKLNNTNITFNPEKKTDKLQIKNKEVQLQITIKNVDNKEKIQPFNNKQLSDINIIKDLLNDKPEKLEKVVTILNNLQKKGDKDKLNSAINQVLKPLLKEKANDIFNGKTTTLKYVIDEKTITRFSKKLIDLKNLDKKVELPKGLDEKIKPLDLIKTLSNSEPPLIEKDDSNDRNYEMLVKNPLKDGKSYIDKVRKNILESPKNNMTPEDVLDCSLKATNNNYSLAVLATHNLLKNIAYNGRTNGAKELSDDNLKIVSKLGNLRSNNTSNDKMGPWYHFFGVQVAYTQTNLSTAGSFIGIEHSIRNNVLNSIRKVENEALYILGFQGKTALSPKDEEKSNIDELSFNISKNFEENKQNNVEKEKNNTISDFIKKGGSFKYPQR